MISLFIGDASIVPQQRTFQKYHSQKVFINGRGRELQEQIMQTPLLAVLYNAHMERINLVTGSAGVSPATEREARIEVSGSRLADGG
jgi:hypothetical protein